jgi:cysteine desulfuration protein SufE
MADPALDNPFGEQISSEDIVETLGFFDAWEDRYKYIIDLGKELPPLPDSLRTDDRLVKGCQSQVWVDVRERDGRLHFAVDSDAFIVKGLLGVVLAAYNHQTPQTIRDFDIEGYFARLDLLSHLSPTRGNGLRAMVARIRRAAGAED